MKLILNVAEKPSVAREVARILSNNTMRRVEGKTKYNPVYEFKYTVSGEDVMMRMTSVQGHIMNLNFTEPHSNWNRVPPEELFFAPLSRVITTDKKELAENLVHCARNINLLALWLDCDREGENIAYEVIQIVKNHSNLPWSMIRRAHFSALTQTDIQNAAQNLGYPKQELSEAVDARQELDLRLGAIFTRFQTIGLKQKIPQLGRSLISWGPCQFPTLGFVVKRYLEILNFKAEKYWSLDIQVSKSNKVAKFKWQRKRLFDFEACAVIYQKALESHKGVVLEVNKSEKSKWRPIPLATVAFQKLVSNKLKFSSDKAMKIAENLYNKGYISYPRTETDFFKTTINLRELVSKQVHNEDWGSYANKLVESDFNWPRNGKNDDQSHPPIHPVKLATKQQLDSDEWKVYELITRHFLASCSKDAKGFETKAVLEYGSELFDCTGLAVTEQNYLEVYPYQKWSENEIPYFEQNEEVFPSEFLMNEHQTQPPSLLSESDLISLMDKAGIGTDATIHQHIKTIQDRNYAVKLPSQQFKPTPLGLALVQAYEKMGTSLHNPELRAKMEAGMGEIANRTKDKESVIQECLADMKAVYEVVKSNIHVLIETVKENLENIPEEEVRDTVTCYICQEPGHIATNCPTRQQGPNQATCFKCGNPGHYSNNCTQKTCSECGQVGRHPRGTNCPAVRRKNRK